MPKVALCMHSVVCHQDHPKFKHIYSAHPAFVRCAMCTVRCSMRVMGCIKQWLAMASCVRKRSRSLPPGSGEEIDDRRAWSCCKSIIFLISSVSFPRSCCSSVCTAICWGCSSVVAEGCAVHTLSRLSSRPTNVHKHGQCASSICAMRDVHRAVFNARCESCGVQCE